jgi:hypothetical protein
MVNAINFQFVKDLPKIPKFSTIFQQFTLNAILMYHISELNDPN